MFTNTAYEQKLFEYLLNIKGNLNAQPIYLGATPSGTGTPPGGWTGYLPQNRVSYDGNEFALITTSNPTTLVDNLNHIRYNIATLSGLLVSGYFNYGITAKEASEIIASGITVLNFGEGFSVTALNDEEILITYSGATGSGHTIQLSGVELEQRSKINFRGAGITVLDDEANDATLITVSGGHKIYTASFGDATPQSIYSLNSQETLLRIEIYVTQGFDGTGASIILGISGDTNLFFESDETYLADSEAFFQKTFQYSSENDIILTIVPGAGASQGQIKILIETIGE